MTHTPAPWIISTDSFKGYSRTRIQSAEGLAIADTMLDYSSILDKETNEANALLIAAAPELLQALKDLVKANNMRMGRTALQLRIDLAIAIINKATGKLS